LDDAGRRLGSVVLVILTRDDWECELVLVLVLVLGLVRARPHVSRCKQSKV
jgi:hypothetical protein